MKKLISLILCVILAVSCAAAFAESTPEKEDLVTINMNGAFMIKGTLFEGYKWTLSPESTASQLVGSFMSDDLTDPVMQLSIALDDSYGDVDRLNDMSDEDKAWLEESFYEDELPGTVTVTKDYTAYGTELFVVHVANDDYEYVDIMTFYKGYFIEFVLVPAEGMSLTDEQVTMCIDFLSELDFVPVEA